MNTERMADVRWLSNSNHTAAPGFVVFPQQGEPTLFGLVTYQANARLGLFPGHLALLTPDGAQRLGSYPLQEFRVV